MAKRKHYKELEQLMTRILLGDAAVFALFLLSSGCGWTALKVICAIIAIVVSGLCLAFLYLNGEIRKRRSLWMVVGFAAVLACLLVSLILRYPAPSEKSILPSETTASTEAAGSVTEGTAAGTAAGTEATATTANGSGVG